MDFPACRHRRSYLGFKTFHFDTDWSLYVFLAFWYFVGMVIALRIVRSPVGAVLRAIRDNPLRAAAVGHNVHGYKLTAFVIAAAYAGFAGGLLGVMQGFMPPDAFMFDTSGQLVMQTAIGGAGTLFGPLVGATVWLYLSDFLQTTLHLGAAWKLVLGVVFVLLVCFLRHGLIGGIEDLYGHLTRPTAAPAEPKDSGPVPGITAEQEQKAARVEVAKAPAPPPMPARRRQSDRSSGPILQASGLTKRYGGLVANSDIDFTVSHGERRGVIGPNGAGKTTFFKMLTCELAANLRHHRVRRPRHHRHERDRRVPARPNQELSGQPAFQPTDRAREPDDRGARRAARQVPARPAAAAAEDSRPCRTGRAHAGARQSHRARSTRRSPRSLTARSAASRSVWRWQASPSLLLLDEPLAGMSPSERIEMVQAAQIDRPGPHHDHHRS